MGNEAVHLPVTYRNERDYPFCPGCGHALVLNELNKALAKLALDPRQVVLVTDIGCQGLGDQYFVTNAFHGLHGRSIAYATGIKLANPELKVIVMIGDGGTGIGGAHLLNAARRNVGLTVLVFNNFNFGMTGGEHSVTTPPGGVTPTTRAGNVERPLDLCATAAANGAGYVWRGTAFDRDLDEVIVAAVQSDSFALLDIWELCTAYYVPNNEFSRRALLDTREQLGFGAGLLHQGNHVEFSRTVRAMAQSGKPGLRPQPIEPQFSSPLDREFRLVVAGSAGGKIRSAVRLVGEAALLAGLQASQSDEYPVTVKTGHSISELILSPHAILYTGTPQPDALVLVSEEGLKQSRRYLESLTRKSWLFVPEEFAGIATPARKVIFDLATSGGQRNKKHEGLLMVAAALRRLGIVPLEACIEAVKRSQPPTIAKENLAVLDASGTMVEARENTAEVAI